MSLSSRRRQATAGLLVLASLAPGCGSKSALSVGEAAPACAASDDDRDGDCFDDLMRGGDDCDDGDASVHPGAPDNEGTGPWRFETVTESDVRGGLSFALDDVGCLHVAFHGEGLEYLSRRTGAWDEVDTGADGDGWTPVMSVEGDGSVHIVHGAASPGARRYATNRSGEWVDSDIDATSSTFRPALALGEDGAPRLVHQEVEYRSTPCGRAVVYSTLGPRGWVAQEVLPRDAGCGIDLDLEIDRGGLPHIALTPGLGSVAYATRGPAAGFVVEPIADTGMFIASVDLALDPGDQPVIAFRDPSRGEISIARRTGRRFSSATVATPDAAGCLAFAIDRRGVEHLAWARRDGETAALFYARSDGRFVAEELPEPLSPFPSECELAVTPAGVAHLAYWADVGALRHATNWSGADGVDQNCDGVDGVDGDGDGLASKLTGGLDCDDRDPRRGRCDPGG